MVGLPNPLSNLLHPHRNASSRAQRNKKAEADPEDADADEDDEDAEGTAEPQVASRTYCSNEIFSLFKMMAAGKGNQKSLAEEVDSDESEGDEPDSPAQPQYKSKSEPKAEQEGADGLRHSGSNTNMQIGGALYDEDDEDADDESRTVIDDHDGESEALKTWRKEHAPSNSDMDAQGQRLAALHLGNMKSDRPPTIRSMSSYRTAVDNCSDSEGDDPELGPIDKSTPILPPIDTTNLSSSPTAQPIKSASSDSDESPSETQHDHNELQMQWESKKEKEMTETQKLQVIIEEFGEVSTLMENLDGTDGPSERILAESHGSLYRGVMTIGNLHLTTHRLLFHAMLPPESALPHANSGSGESSNQHHSIIHSGPVTIHRPGVLRPARRWLELTADMVTSYPRADESGRIRPIRCVLLSSVSQLEPFDPEHPNDFRMVYQTANGIERTHMSVDTEQSAMQWRRAFEGALFRHAHSMWKAQHAKKMGLEPGSGDDDQWTMMRACVPLDRIRVSGMQDYHNFVTLLGLEIDLRGETIDFSPENDLEADHDGHQNHPQEPLPTVGIERTESPATMAPPAALRPPPLSPPALDGHGRFPCDRTNKLVSRFSSMSHSSATTELKAPSPARTPSQVSQMSTKSTDGTKSPGVDTPTKKFSLRNTLDKLAPSHSHSQSRESSSSGQPKASTGPQWLDSTIPGPLAKAAGGIVSGKPEDWGELGPESEYSFNVAVQQEQTWFVGSLQAAVAEAKQRRYKAGAKRPKMVLNVAGYDCLITDEDLDHTIKPHEDTSSDSGEEHSSPDEMEDGPDVGRPSMLKVKAARKAEKASMAAKIFGLNESEGIWLKRGFVVQGVIPYRGHLIVSPRFLCFWRRATFGRDIKYRFKSSDVKGVVEASAVQIGYHGLALHIAGHHDLKLEFRFKASRTEAIKHIQTIINLSKEGKTAHSDESSLDAPPTPSDADSSIKSVISAPVGDAPAAPNRDHPADILAPPKEALFKTRAWPDEALAYMPFVANRPRESATRLSPRTFAMLTIGSRGDVQPYIALGLRLKKDGHTIVIITHDEFKGWIEGYGLIHRQAGGDPTALMKLSQEHAMFSPGFFKESLGSFRKWLDDLLLDAWNACYDADVLIESPSAMAGIHIAEARHIPYFRAFTMPWTRTNAYPQAFMVPSFEMGPSFNYSTYVLFDNIIWAATAPQINRWRKEHLNLKSTDMSSLSITKVPFLYNFSSAVVPKPLDWKDDISITGYWNLEDSDTDWSPPDGLEQFMKKARDDGKALVYIGFGSIVVPRPNAMTKSIIKAVQKADVRAIIAKGWSSRGGDPAKEGGNIEFPDSCFGLEKVPHGWLFPRVDAALHHGGAGTVGASLRAGIPTLIKPWFGDQFFWANRVTKLEVGLKVPSLRSDDIAQCLHKATTSTLMIEKAKRVGELIRSENGVDNAVAAIQFNIVRAVSDRKKMTYQK